MPTEPVLRVTFWGVTGSYPRTMTDAELRATLASDASGEPFTYGGDTTCIQIEAGDQLFIVDAGTGMQRLSQTLATRARESAGRRGEILLTHAHFDHVCALPFLEPLYDPQSHFNVYGAVRTARAIESLGRVGEPLAGVFFPQTLAHLPGLKRFVAIEAGTSIDFGDVRVTAHALNHPGGSLAYRIDRGGKRVVIATDHEQPCTPDLALAEFARGADLLYMDAQYLRAEYEGSAGVAGEPPQSRVGWGHTPLEDCLPTASAAEAKRLLLGHHEPRRGDAALGELATKVRAMRATCRVELAYQGLVIEL